MESFAAAEARTRLALAAALWMVTWVVPFLQGRFRPFHRLPLDRRVDAWNRGERGLLSPLFVVLKVVLCLHWFEQPEAAASIGHAPALVGGPR